MRQFWRFNLILTHCGFLGRASAKQSEISENSENSEHSDGLADARTMVCRSWLTAYPPWRRWGVVWSGTACHRLPGWQLYMCSRCSGHVADTPVGEIPGYAQPATASGVAEMLASCHRLRRQRRADAALRQSSVSVQPRASARRTPLHRPWCERQQAIQRARSAPRSPITATMRCVSEPRQVQPHRHYVSWGVPLARIPYILH